MNVPRGFLAFFFVATCLTQENRPTNDGGCAEYLRIPEYPRLGLLAQIGGSVAVVVRLDDQSVAEHVEVAEGRPHGILYKAVLDAVRESRFAAACRNRSVTLRFEFVLAKNAVENRQPSKLFFGYPNRFWIVAAPLLYQP
jgi:TonB family protein